jgi:hypothetical protein
MGLRPYNRWNHITTVGTILQPLKPYYKMRARANVYTRGHIYMKSARPRAGLGPARSRPQLYQQADLNITQNIYISRYER